VRFRIKSVVLASVSLALAIGMFAPIVEADRPDYWLCVDERGVEWAQDFPCQPSQSAMPGRGRWAQPAPQTETNHRAPVQSSSEPSGHGTSNMTDRHVNTVPPPTIELPDLLSALRPTIDLLVSLIPWLLFIIGLVVVAAFLGTVGGVRPKKRKRGVIAAPSIWTILFALLRAVRRVLKNQPPGERAGRDSKARVPPTVAPSSDPQPTEWSLDLIRALEWRRFETLCQEIWRFRGHRCESTGKGADGGVDLLIYSKRKPDQCIALVQCKSRTNSVVRVGTVRELYGVQKAQNVKQSVLMTSGTFTDDAVAFAKGQQMRLFDRTRILAAVQAMPEAQQKSLLQRLTGGAYRTPSCPKCEALMVLKSTQSDGMRVYGCPNFPLCRPNTIKVPELKPV